MPRGTAQRSEALRKAPLAGRRDRGGYDLGDKLLRRHLRLSFQEFLKCAKRLFRTEGLWWDASALFRSLTAGSRSPNEIDANARMR